MHCSHGRIYILCNIILTRFAARRKEADEIFFTLFFMNNGLRIREFYLAPVIKTANYRAVGKINNYS